MPDLAEKPLTPTKLDRGDLEEIFNQKAEEEVITQQVPKGTKNMLIAMNFHA